MGIWAAGANPPAVLKACCGGCCWACLFSFPVVGYLSGTDIPNGVLGLSTADNGVLSLPSPGFIFSRLLFLFRVKVDMERVGREDTLLGAVDATLDEAYEPVDEAGFSGEKESASVPDGVFLCEDEDVPVVAEVFVRREADRERRREAPISATEEEMLWREVCLLCRRGGVSGACWCGLGGSEEDVSKKVGGIRVFDVVLVRANGVPPPDADTEELGVGEGVCEAEDRWEEE